jgi:transposase
MSELPDLKQLSEEAKDALIVALWKELQTLRQKKAKKTAKNSSLPPAKGFKSDVKGEEKPRGGKRKGSVGRAGGGRKLSEAPDQTLKATVTSCQACGTAIVESLQQLVRRYDKIELPPIAPIVTRVEQYGCECPSCGKAQVASVPAGLEAGSPYGNRIAALVTSLRYSHAISYRRLQQLLGEVFGITISEGAIANLLTRVQRQLQPAVDGILTLLRRASIVCSDETSARVNGKNQWEWVFQNEQVCFHLIRDSRGAEVIEAVMAEHRPEVWVSDLFSAQKTHPGDSWQVCLAHQLRDCQYGIDAGDQIFSQRMKTILLRAFVLRNRWSDLSAATRYQYRCRLERDLKAALALSPTQADGLRLQKRYRTLQDNLFLFLDNPAIPATNNASEQALRWSVVFRKVTNGFRSEWGRDLFAAVRSVVNTGQRHGLSAFDAIFAVLKPVESLVPLG